MSNNLGVRLNEKELDIRSKGVGESERSRALEEKLAILESGLLLCYFLFLFFIVSLFLECEILVLEVAK